MSDLALAIFMTILTGLVIVMIKQEGKRLMAGIDELQTQVQANTDVEASALTLIQGLHDQLVAAGTDPTKLAELKDKLKNSGDALAAAVAANTPAAPNP